MPQNLNDKALAELICTRLSHDIIGNIGAVANAVELLEEGDMDFLDDIKSILKTSSAVLSSRLKFFRMVFGLDNANLEQPALVESTLRNYLATIGNRNYPIELSYSLQTSRFVKPVMLAVMILADTLIRGGKIEILEADGKISVAATFDVAPSLDKINQIKELLTGSGTETDARFAPVFYLISLLKQEKINLYILNSPSLGFVFA